jgi:hypothetical protein
MGKAKRTLHLFPDFIAMGTALALVIEERPSVPSFACDEFYAPSP